MTAKFTVVFLACLALFSPCWAQVSPPYLKAATFYIAADGWVDIWLNGIPIIENQRSTSDDATYQTTTCLPKHLCYFQDDNVLAFDNDNAYRSQPPLNSQIGIAYILKLKFSDGTEQTLSSNDVEAHKAYYSPNRATQEPQGWQKASFNDETWSSPFIIGTGIPAVAPLEDPETSQPIQFLSASNMSFKAQHEGEKHLYRREFSLNISSNPLCNQARGPSFQRPMEKIPPPTPTEIPMPPQRIPLPPSFTPSPTETPMSAPALVWKPALVPTATFTSWPTATWTALPQDTPTPGWRVLPPAKPTVTFGLIPFWTPSSSPTPTFTTRPVIRLLSRKPRRFSPTPTPIPGFETTNRADPFEVGAPAAMPKVATVTPTTVEAASSAPSQPQTVVFQRMPANIYISFADGPGVYRLEVVDGSGAHLRSLFEKRVVAEQDEWVEWDGKDDGGRDMPPGQYVVLYTKDGEKLNQLVLIKAEPGQEDSKGNGS